MLATFVTDILRLLVWLVLLVLVFGLAERWWPRRAARLWRPGMLQDLAYYFASGFVPKLLLALPLSALAWLLHHTVPSAYYAWVAEWPLWLRLPLALVVADFGAYWGHRLAHRVPFLWRFHAVHHSPEHIDWLVNTRAHPFDLAFNRLCALVPTYVLGLSQPAAGGLDLAPLLVLVIGNAWGFFVHANVRWRFGWLEHCLSTPAFHHWHHAHGDVRLFDKNFASMLPWMDRLFGTLHLPPRDWPERYGSDTPVSPTLAGQLIDPLRPLVADKRLVERLR